MIATRLARFLAARGIHYGWLMIALTFLYGVCATAAMSIPGILLAPISKDLGWTIGELSGPLGLRMTLFGLVAPFAGGSASSESSPVRLNIQASAGPRSHGAARRFGAWRC